MNWTAIAFDWNQIRAFLATVEEGSLSAAARALGQTQPTLSRQITALETDLGVTLFERGARASTPTRAALELVEHVRAMGEAAQRISLTASGQSLAIEGKVSITATDIMATYFLPPVMARLRETAPMIEIEIVAANELRDLARREADIAIRHARPEQPDLIARLIGEITARLYAAPAYLDRVGRPASFEEISRLDFVGIGREAEIIAHLNARGLSLSPENFRLTSTSGTAYLALVREGLGVGMMTSDVAKLHPDLEEVCPNLEPTPVPIWLVAHRELHTSRRIRLVFDTIAEMLRLPS